jgi:hypothetical protein
MTTRFVVNQTAPGALCSTTLGGLIRDRAQQRRACAAADMCSVDSIAHCTYSAHGSTTTSQCTRKEGTCRRRISIGWPKRDFSILWI